MSDQALKDKGSKDDIALVRLDTSRLLHEDVDDRNVGQRVKDSFGIFSGLAANATDKGLEHISKNPGSVAETVVVSAAIAATIASAAKNPAILGKRISAGILSTAERSLPIMSGVAALDWSCRIGSPMLQAYSGDRKAAKDNLARNVGEGAVTYSAGFLGGLSGAYVGLKIAPGITKPLILQNLSEPLPVKSSFVDKLLSKPFDQIKAITQGDSHEVQAGFRASDKALQLQEGDKLTAISTASGRERVRAQRLGDNPFEMEITIRPLEEQQFHWQNRAATVTFRDIASNGHVKTMDWQEPRSSGIRIGDQLRLGSDLDYSTGFIQGKLATGKYKVTDLQGNHHPVALKGKFEVTNISADGTVVLREAYSEQRSFTLPKELLTESNFHQIKPLNLSSGDRVVFPKTDYLPSTKLGSPADLENLRSGKWTVAGVNDDAALLTSGTRIFAVKQSLLVEPHAYKVEDWILRSTAFNTSLLAASSSELVTANQWTQYLMHGQTK